ncbi:MAG: MerR family transcriptional regulator [Proteobacteria bacterium]|nr:MerR family transcriptional regulator [Pseudomonadota bacterium]
MRRNSNDPVYVISVAARLVEVHPQTLRLYERLGLVKPKRNDNNIRLYSDLDIERLGKIQRLTSVGLNLAGVEMVLDLLERMEAMRQEFEEEMDRRQEQMDQEIARLRRPSAGARG